MKRNVKNILFAFAAAALSCAMASCSHSSDSDDEETPGSGNVTGGVTTRSISEKESVTFNVETNSTDAENTNIVFTYDRSAAGAKEKITIKNCNIEIAVNGEAKTVTELNFILNEYGDCTGDKATQYQCKIPVGKKLSAGDTVTVTFKSKNGDFSGEGESTAKIDTLTVSLIDNAEAANWYNELVANSLEHQPLFNKENSSNNGDPVTPPAGDEGNTGKIVFDFTKAVKDGKVTIDKVTYCSVNTSKFNAEDGLTLEVSSAWDGAFKIATEPLDLSNQSVIVEYKIDEGWKYTSNNGKKCLIQLISKEQNSGEYKPIELSQGEFANDPATTGSWQTATIDNIYKNNWDVENDDKDKDSYVGADLTKIIAIKINTTDGEGTIHIKSIKFVDK